MGSWFSKSKRGEAASSSRVTEQDKAVLGLKQQRDKIKQYQLRIQQALDKERELARQLIQQGRKDRAKLLLKKKRFQESQLEKSETLLDNLEKMVHDLEFAQVEVQVLEGLKAGTEALKKIHDVLSVDEVERILEESKEGIEKQAEIDALLSNNLSPEDLESVETEYEQILALEGLSQLTPDQELPAFPQVPVTPIPEHLEAEKRKSKEKTKEKGVELLAS